MPIVYTFLLFFRIYFHDFILQKIREKASDKLWIKDLSCGRIEHFGQVLCFPWSWIYYIRKLVLNLSPCMIFHLTKIKTNDKIFHNFTAVNKEPRFFRFKLSFQRSLQVLPNLDSSRVTSSVCTAPTMLTTGSLF
jgi:hypothetical protein